MATALATTAFMAAIVTYFPNIQFAQDALELFQLFKNAHPVLNIVWKGVWSSYVAVLGPTIEEVVFRGLLNDGVQYVQGLPQTTLKKVMRIALCSLIFGACHLSPFQNMPSNIIILGVTTTMGFVLVLLREQRKDLTAPIATHITHNSIAVVMMLLS
jgi:membrane protease YdiL (CAAX protease family)